MALSLKPEILPLHRKLLILGQVTNYLIDGKYFVAEEDPINRIKYLYPFAANVLILNEML